MKFNSQICTSREQSEHLLALGLKKETRDAVLKKYIHNDKYCYKPVFEDIEDSFIDCNDLYPAWSLDRLRELIPENIFTGVRNQWHRVMYNGVLTYEEGYDSLISFREINIYDRCISCIEWLIKEGYFPKEYLV